MGGFDSTRWGWMSTKPTVESSHSLDINRLNRAGCLEPGYRGGWNGGVMASRPAGSGSGEIAMHWFCRIRSGGTPRNSRISSNELRSSGRRAGSVVPGRSSSVQVSSMGLPAVGGWPSSMEPELIFSAATVICSPMLRNAKIASTVPCAGANKVRMRLGGEPVMTALFPDRPKGMHRQTYQRLQSAALNAEISAEERLVFVLARLEGMDRRSNRRSTGRSKRGFWT